MLDEVKERKRSRIILMNLRRMHALGVLETVRCGSWVGKLYAAGELLASMVGVA